MPLLNAGGVHLLSKAVGPVTSSAWSGARGQPPAEWVTSKDEKAFRKNGPDTSSFPAFCLPQGALRVIHKRQDKMLDKLAVLVEEEVNVDISG